MEKLSRYYSMSDAKREEAKKSSRRRLRTKPRTGSIKRPSRTKCSAVTRKQVCGPSRKSCHYPNIYSRKNLLREASKDEIVLDEFEPGAIPKLSTPQLCSFLGLASKESIKFNRVINGKICGPDPEKSNPKVWTKDQLLSYIKSNNILPSGDARKLSRQELCVYVADWSYKKKTSKTTFKLPHTSINVYPVLNYKGDPSHILPFIYGLLLQYPDICFFMDSRKAPGEKKPDYYTGIRYNCDTEEIQISSNLIREMKGCNTRFFTVLIRLTETRDEDMGKHANILLYDKKQNEVWHYEGLRKGLYHECNTQKLFSFFRDLFKREINSSISFIDAPSYCPNLNLARKLFEQRHKGFYTEEFASGLCIIINLWVLNNKLNYPDLSLKEVNERAIKALAENEYGMLNHILNWMNDRLENRKVLMKQAEKVKKNFKKYMADLIYAKQIHRYSPGSLPPL